MRTVDVENPSVVLCVDDLIFVTNYHQVCIAPDEYATYYYDVGLRTGSDELFPVVRHNTFAPTTTVNGEIVNFWEPGDDCASLDIMVHSKTE